MYLNIFNFAALIDHGNNCLYSLKKKWISIIPQLKLLTIDVFKVKETNLQVCEKKKERSEVIDVYSRDVYTAMCFDSWLDWCWWCLSSCCKKKKKKKKKKKEKKKRRKRRNKKSWKNFFFVVFVCLVSIWYCNSFCSSRCLTLHALLVF